ncbi:hypothetical protein WJX74_000880 [Apatococcus lobatus]|uniref:Phosphodiesterase n=1 Tax=Apatococcus lobatus TaxID=904363 RepID=A0AAW1RDP9_9CHLO
MTELTEEGVSKLEVFKILDLVAAPTFAWRPTPGSASAGVFWCNASARKRLGRIWTAEEQQKIADECPEPVRQATETALAIFHESVVVKRLSSTCSGDPRQLLFNTFSAIPESEVACDLHVGPLCFEMDAQEYVVALAQWRETSASAPQANARAACMLDFSPIHSYLFAADGKLLHANNKAAGMIKMAGKNEENFQLHELLLEDGQEQQEVAREARAAIFDRSERAFRCTLHSLGKDGKASWILYECWLNYDTVAAGGRFASAMLVNTFDVTDQKELERQLASARLQLLKQNEELEASNGQLKANEQIILNEKARLIQQQQKLQHRLKLALKIHQVQPRTYMDTMTIADKIVSALDAISEGETLQLEEVLQLRNAVLEADDLRRPVNLQHQLLHKAGLSTDVGLAMTEMLQGDSNSGAQRLARSRSLAKSTSSKDFSESLSRSQCRHRSSAETCDPTGGNAAGDQVAVVLIPEVERLLMEANGSFSFDAFKLAEASGNRPLSTLGFFFIKGSGLMTAFNICENQLVNFLQQIEAGYPDNPYHNRVHATCVLQVMHLLMQNGLIKLGVLQDVMVLACYLAAICHDFEHPGVNNDFLIKTGNRKALMYNDISPLENHHVSASFMVAADRPQANIFQGMSEEDRGTIRASMIDLILGTDMKKHFGLLSRFQAYSAQTSLQSPELRDRCLSQAPASSSTISAEHKLLIAQVALKCADIGHLSCPLALHQRWTDQLREEFFLQGDQEQQHRLKVSPLMDRSEASGMIKSQVGFFEIVALPLFTGYTQLIPDSKPLLDGVMSNYQHWHAGAKE